MITPPPWYERSLVYDGVHWIYLPFWRDDCPVHGACIEELKVYVGDLINEGDEQIVEINDRSEITFYRVKKPYPRYGEK